MVETINKMKVFFENKQATRKVLAGAAEKYKEVWTMLFNDIALIEENKPAIADMRNVSDIVRHMKNWVMFEAMNIDTLRFINDFALVIYNWNNNSHRDPRLHDDCTFIMNLTDGNLSMRDTINILKHLNKRMSDLRSWNPPAFEISKSLMNSLKK